MMELGDHTAEGHQLARDVARECGIECWVVGGQFANHAPGTGPSRIWRDLLAALEKDTPSGRTVLLKGSRSMQLESLVPHL